MIRNLIENGIKFTRANRNPHIWIDAGLVQDNVLTRVCDNGPVSKRNIMNGYSGCLTG